MAQAAKLPVKTERKLSEPALAMHAWWPIESLRREIDHLVSGARHSVAHCSQWNHCGGPN